MFVKEFNAISARDLNKQLNKVYNWQLDLTKINENDATRMLTTIQNKMTNSSFRRCIVLGLVTENKISNYYQVIVKSSYKFNNCRES